MIIKRHWFLIKLILLFLLYHFETSKQIIIYLLGLTISRSQGCLARALLKNSGKYCLGSSSITPGHTTFRWISSNLVMDRIYVDILKGENCRQLMLLTWTSFIGQFVHQEGRSWEVLLF